MYQFNHICDGSVNCLLYCIFQPLVAYVTRNLRYDEDQGFKTAANLTPTNYIVFQNGW